MGLAASQARFLGLTARKSNVEYQGQQINQARTALSNEVMALYQEYNNLDVPTPPLVNDFVKTVYKIDSTGEDYQISSFSKITDGEYSGLYNVILSYGEDIPKARTYAAGDSTITVKESGDTYSYINFQIGTDTYTYDADFTSNTITKITGDYEKYAGLTTIMKEKGLTNGVFYMYNRNGVNYFTSEQDLKDTQYNSSTEGKKIYNGTYAFDYQGVYSSTKTATAIAALEQDTSGRLSSIRVAYSDDAIDLVGSTYSITTSQEDDQQGYEDAMNQYNYEKQKYENEVERINKKTAKIQAEDKGLELKLGQLDTEQNAIKTEMEAVSKVIEETIEKVFKTFSS